MPGESIIKRYLEKPNIYCMTIIQHNIANGFPCHHSLAAFNEILSLAATVARGVSMTCLTHGHHIAQNVCAASGNSVNLPCPAQLCVTPPSVVATCFHLTLA